MKRRITYGILLLLAARCFVFCGTEVLRKWKEYQQSRDYYEEIGKAAEEASGQAGEGSAEDLPDTLPGADRYINWDLLEGSDIVGWLQLDEMDYPVMQGQDNSFYLHHLPDGRYNYGGSLFLDVANTGDFTDCNSIIYGHNMADGSMFGNLKHIVSQEHAEDTFFIYTPDGRRHAYRYFSVQYTDLRSEAYRIYFAGDPEFKGYQKTMQKSSAIRCKKTVEGTSKIVTLSTCNGSAGTAQRLLLQGIEIDCRQTQEAAPWYKEIRETCK